MSLYSQNLYGGPSYSSPPSAPYLQFYHQPLQVALEDNNEDIEEAFFLFFSTSISCAICPIFLYSPGPFSVYRNHLKWERTRLMLMLLVHSISYRCINFYNIISSHQTHRFWQVKSLFTLMLIGDSPISLSNPWSPLP